MRRAAGQGLLPNPPLADFDWDEGSSRMLYASYTLKYGQLLAAPEGTISSIRLYDLEELRRILGDRGLQVRRAWGGYDTATPASEDRLDLLVFSEKGQART